MNKICESDKCSGCYGCVNICPKKCIEMVENNLGELHPRINMNQCIDCGLCKKVCPQNTSIKENRPLKCFAAYTKNDEKRLDSASGGVARILYEEFLAQNKNANVFGVELNEENIAVYSKTKTIEEITKYQGSKYVQAMVGDSFEEISLLLKNDESVIFVGTPCQVKAGLNVLKNKNICTDKLITVDLLCHGVSPQKYLDETLQFYSDLYKLEKINALSFRSNRLYRNFHLYFEGIRRNGKRKIYNFVSGEEPYFYGFLSGTTLRESCYNCKFSTTDRVGDITIGDFIGLGSFDKYGSFEGKSLNASMILCNTEKGLKFIETMRDVLYLFERQFEEAVEGGCSLREPYKRSELRSAFVKKYSTGKFVYVMNEIAGEKLQEERKKNKFTKKIKMFILTNKFLGPIATKIYKI